MVHNGWHDAQADLAGMHLEAGTPVVAGAEADLARARMTVPAHVRLGPDRDRLEWIPAEAGELDGAGRLRWWRQGKPVSGAIRAFIKLATEPDEEQFVDFARHFGVLALDAHARLSPGMGAASGETWHGCAVTWEPIGAWRVYAANARAIVHLAIALRGRERIDAARVLGEAGLDVDPFPEALTPPSWIDEATGHEYATNLAERLPATLALNLDEPGHSLASQRHWLAGRVTRHWIATSSLVPTIDWTDDRPRLTLPIGRAPAGMADATRPQNMLFDILATQLAALICSGDPIGTCSRCGKLHPRARKPRADQLTYCDVCRPHAERQRKCEHAARRRAHERAATS